MDSSTLTLPHRVLAVDPATGNSGWAVLDILSFAPLQVKVVATGLIDGNKVLKERLDMAEVCSKQFCVLDVLQEVYVYLVETFRPHRVVSESAFGYVHMSALISLTLAIQELRRAVWKVQQQSITTIPPTISKKAFAGNGSADKVKMREAYETASWLIRQEMDIPISEHEIDAIAHGVGYVKRDITKEVEQISAKDKKKAKKERALEKAGS